VYIILLLLLLLLLYVYIHVRNSTPFHAVGGYINGFRRLRVRWVPDVTFDMYTKQNMYANYWLIYGELFPSMFAKGILYDDNVIWCDVSEYM
jgi:hypothetical protein